MLKNKGLRQIVNPFFMSEPVRQIGQKGVFLRGFTTKGTTIFSTRIMT